MTGDRMGSMTSPPYDDRLQLRTPSQVREMVERLAFELRSTPLRFWGKRLTQEAVINAIFLWADSVGKDRLVKELSSELTRLEALMSYEGTGVKNNGDRPVKRRSKRA